MAELLSITASIVGITFFTLQFSTELLVPESERAYFVSWREAYPEFVLR